MLEGDDGESTEVPLPGEDTSFPDNDEPPFSSGFEEESFRVEKEMNATNPLPVGRETVTGLELGLCFNTPVGGQDEYLYATYAVRAAGARTAPFKLLNGNLLPTRTADMTLHCIPTADIPYALLT